MVRDIIYIEMLFIFSTPVLIRHLWQLKTVAFLHWCLICTFLLDSDANKTSFLRFVYTRDMYMAFLLSDAILIEHTQVKHLSGTPL